MGRFVLEVLVSALLSVGAAKPAHRHGVAGAVLASLPLTFLAAMIGLWRDGAPQAQVADSAAAMLWLVLASLLLFVVTPLLWRNGFGFWPSRSAGRAATIAGYSICLHALRLRSPG